MKYKKKKGKNRQFDHCLKSRNHGITIATFYQKARDVAGVDLDMTMREMMNLSRKDKNSLNSLKVSKSHINNIKCNNNSNILNNNDLRKEQYLGWDFETLRLLRLSTPNSTNGYTFSDKLNEEELPSFLSNIVRLHSDVVNRDKMTIGTLYSHTFQLGHVSKKVEHLRKTSRTPRENRLNTSGKQVEHFG